MKGDVFHLRLFEPFRRLVKVLQGPSIKDFSKNISIRFVQYTVDAIDPARAVPMSAGDSHFAMFRAKLGR